MTVTLNFIYIGLWSLLNIYLKKRINIGPSTSRKEEEEALFVRTAVIYIYTKTYSQYY